MASSFFNFPAFLLSLYPSALTPTPIPCMSPTFLLSLYPTHLPSQPVPQCTHPYPLYVTHLPSQPVPQCTHPHPLYVTCIDPPRVLKKKSSISRLTLCRSNFIKIASKWRSADFPSIKYISQMISCERQALLSPVQCYVQYMIISVISIDDQLWDKRCSCGGT